MLTESEGSALYSEIVFKGALYEKDAFFYGPLLEQAGYVTIKPFLSKGDAALTITPLGRSFHLRGGYFEQFNQQQKREEERQKQELIEKSLREREVNAAEQSANEAKRSADAAEQSVKEAKSSRKAAWFSGVVALVVGIYAILQYYGDNNQNGAIKRLEDRLSVVEQTIKSQKSSPRQTIHPVQSLPSSKSFSK